MPIHNLTIVSAFLPLLPALVLLGSGTTLAQTYGDPPDDHHPWAVHDPNRPVPVVVQPGATPGAPPSDATILFDGTEAALGNWMHLKPEDKRKGSWIVKDGALQCVPGSGYIGTKEEFGDCQLHIEWAAPTPVRGDGQGRGNSGVFLMGVEVQVLDNYDNPTYADGTAGAVYGIMPPAVNALRPVGEWQSYDIIFRRPLSKDGKVIDQGSYTVLVNGVVVQDSTPLEGGSTFRKRGQPGRIFPDKGKLTLQDHGNPVRYRNIWIRSLPPRPADGGFDGWLSADVTAAKRAEIAAEIRDDAAGKSGVDKMLRLLESLHYAPDDAAWSEADGMAKAFAAKVSAAPDSEVVAQRDDIIRVSRALKYLAKFKRIPADYPVISQLETTIKAHKWKARI